MIWSLAWRNVWRNKKRSIIIILAVAFGLWGGVLTTGIMNGMSEQMVDAAVRDRLAHIQIHHPDFRASRRIADVLPGGPSVLTEVRRTDGVLNASGRSVISGMASSATTAQGISIYGIEPADEPHISDIHERIIEGTYFETTKRNAVIVGQELIEKLDVRLGHKIVLTAQDYTGDISAGAFRIVGVFRTVSSDFDKSTVFARGADVDRIFHLKGHFHEIAIKSADYKAIDSLSETVAARFSELDVASWRQLAPELSIMTDSTLQMMYIFLIIILVALAFSVTNTMLMAVLERVREFGVIMALGMQRLKILGLVVLESVLIALVGSTLGLIGAALSIARLADTGIDLTIVAKGLAKSGLDKIIYPAVPTETYLWLLVLVIIVALLSSIYPALKAVRLNPVNAIRTFL